MFGNSKSVDPTKTLQKELVAAQARRHAHTNRLTVAQAQLLKEEANVKAQRDADREVLKTARFARQEVRDEVEEMTAAVADDDAEISRIEGEIAGIDKRRRQQERHDTIMRIVPRVDEANQRLDDALAYAATVYGEAAIESADFSAVHTAVSAFREPLATAIVHARATLPWLASQALKYDPPALIEDKPKLALVPKASEPPPVRVFSIQPVSFVAGPTDLIDPAKVIRKGRFQNFQVSEQQARIGYAHDWLIPEDHPSAEALRKHKDTDQAPGIHLCHSLDEPVAAPELLVPEVGDDPVLQAANFTPMPRTKAPSKFIAPPAEQQPRSAAGARTALPEGFSPMPGVQQPYSLIVDPRLDATHRAAVTNTEDDQS